MFILLLYRAAPVGTTDAYYYFHISSNDGSGSGFVYLGTCSSCLFRVSSNCLGFAIKYLIRNNMVVFTLALLQRIQTVI